MLGFSLGSSILLPIAITGITVAFFHATIPTHWLPFVLAGRARRWSHKKTLGVVAVAGLGHGLFNTILGALIVFVGAKAEDYMGTTFPTIVGAVVCLFGLYYLAQQFRGHHHHHHHHAESPTSTRSDLAVMAGLWLMLTFSPCEGFLPVYLSGAQYGLQGYVLLSLILLIGTTAGMVLFTALAASGVSRLKLSFFERYENAVLGTALLVLGVVILVLGV